MKNNSSVHNQKGFHFQGEYFQTRLLEEAMWNKPICGAGNKPYIQKACKTLALVLVSVLSFHASSEKIMSYTLPIGQLYSKLYNQYWALTAEFGIRKFLFDTQTS